MVKAFHKLLVLSVVLSLLIPATALAQTSASPAADDIATITVLHTNDFHGNLEPIFNKDTKYPGMARVATKVNEIETAVGEENVVLFDAGDQMQGSLLSNINKGIPVIDVYNTMGYDAATLGNHEFDWGQTTLIERVGEANFPYLAANLTTGTCTDPNNWTSPSFSQPWTTLTVGAPGNQAVLGVIGVTSTETPYITVAEATAGLCFKDAADSILHYYDEVVAAGADAIVVISHLGLNDGGYGYGFPVYGDKTLAAKLNAAGKPVNLIIGGHSHTNVSAAEIVGSTTVVQAHSAGRKLGKATLTINKTTGVTTVAWERVLVDANDGTAFSVPEDATIKTLINTYALDPDYLELVDQIIGFSAVDLTRNYNGDSMMGAFVQDAVYNELNSDAEDLNDVDMVFNNPGGLRNDLSTPDATYPYTLTYGMLFTVLPFGNQTVVGDMTGAQVMELLNQSAALFKGAIQPAGIEYTFYSYTDTLPGPQPYAWGAFDVQVKNRDTGLLEPIDLAKTYRVATNEFLAPAGQDGFTAFKYMTNISYWGDMLNQVIAWTEANHATKATAYNGPDGDGTLDDRITRDGNAAGGSVIPVTLLHHADSHGRLLKSGSTVGYSQLATVIKQEKAHNSDRTLLLTAGDNIQGDSMMYYFKSAGLGYAADGTALPDALQINPLIAAFNEMDYDAMTIGNHEYNFGKEVFGTLKDANFPMLQANVADSGEYGLAAVPVEPYTVVTVGPENIDVAVLGIGNHRIPNYELPSNIPGLTFSNPIETAQDLAPDLKAENDVVVALTHIGFTTDPKSVEVDVNVDTELAKQATSIDAILGGHSHTHPTTKSFIPDPYQYLPTIEVNADGEPVIINHTNRYNTFLGQIVLGLLPDGDGGYEVVAQAGRDIEITSSVAEDPAIKAVVDPYAALLQTYNNTEIGQTTAPIDAITAYTEETTGANLQADASISELRENGIEVDFHLSGAMTNRAVATTATPASPVILKVSDMFTVMPYENSLLVMELNGPQLKQILERAYRNYFYYKYIPGYGGYSYYTTCMLSTNAGNVITYKDTYPALPDGNNVASLEVGGQPIDFEDADTYYNVSTVNYLAAGSCNFNDQGQTLWPLDQIVADTQYYVRDAVINYITKEGTVSPAIEGRLQFVPGTAPLLEVTKTGPDYALVGEEIVYTIEYASTSALTLPGVKITDTLPAGLTTADPTVWDIGDLESGEGDTLTLTAMVDPALECGTILTNTVTMTDLDGNTSTSTIATPAYCAAVASFGVSSSAVETGQEVVFTNTSTGSEPLSYLWDFGDGITTTVESPTHAFTNPGNYTVSLTVKNDISEDVAKRVIVVKGYPTIGTLYAPLIFKPTPVE